MGTAVVVALVVIVLGCVAVVWHVNYPALPIRPRSYYDNRDFGRLKDPAEPEPPELTEAMTLLRSARRDLHDTLAGHHLHGRFPAILSESHEPLFVSSNSPHLYVFTESLQDRDSHPYWTKTLRATPACTWTVQVGISRMGRSQEERISLTIDTQARPRLSVSNSHHRYPGTADGWAALIRDLVNNRKAV